MKKTFIIIFLLALVGCGYHIAGKGGKMPGDLASLDIPVFANATHKANIEAILTNAFVEEMVTTVKVGGDGDGTMQGVIRSYNLTAVSYSKSDVNQEYRLSVVLSVTLLKNGAVIWKDENISDYEDFVVNTSDVTATKEAEEAALRKLARDTARIVKERLLENF
ncbi:MAG: hypothetical protein HY956_04915 [Deltaproteobacteria bacterium]|nr:hypothetical protein [Deltaproteobacteria bacterium]